MKDCQTSLFAALLYRLLLKVDFLPFICAPVLQLLSERLQKNKYCRQTSQSWYSRVKFHSFVIFNKSSTKISHLNADLSLSLFRSVLSSVLNFDTFWVNSSICLIFVNFRLARNGKIFFYVAGVFECLREANYREFCSRGLSKQLQALQHGEFSRGTLRCCLQSNFIFLGHSSVFRVDLDFEGLFVD